MTLKEELSCWISSLSWHIYICVNCITIVLPEDLTDFDQDSRDEPEATETWLEDEILHLYDCRSGTSHSNVGVMLRVLQ